MLSHQMLGPRVYPKNMRRRDSSTEQVCCKRGCCRVKILLKIARTTGQNNTTSLCQTLAILRRLFNSKRMRVNSRPKLYHAHSGFSMERHDYHRDCYHCQHLHHAAPPSPPWPSPPSSPSLQDDCDNHCGTTNTASLQQLESPSRFSVPNPRLRSPSPIPWSRVENCHFAARTLGSASWDACRLHSTEERGV